LLKECGLTPIQVAWARLCARFWNRYLKPKLTRATLRQDVALFQGGSDSCWSAKFLDCMARLRLTGGKDLEELRDMDLNEVCDL